MFFLNHQYFVDQDEFISFESIIARNGLRYFSSQVKVIIFFSHHWLDSRTADKGECFLECKNHVDQIISGFRDQQEDLKYFGFFFDYACIPQCGDGGLFSREDQVFRKLKRLLLIELYQTLTQSATLHLCRANSRGYHTRIWIVMELLIALDKGIARFPTAFRADPHLPDLERTAREFRRQRDIFGMVRRLTDGLESTLAEDRTATQLTLYRYLSTRDVQVPIELMNRTMHNMHGAFAKALSGDLGRLEQHVDSGLANWKASIEDMGFDDEFLDRLRDFDA